jgi:hypothetical protein
VRRYSEVLMRAAEAERERKASKREAVRRYTMTPPDPQLKGAWYQGGFNPCTYQVKTRIQNIPFECNLHRYKADLAAAALKKASLLNPNASTYTPTSAAVGNGGGGGGGGGSYYDVSDLLDDHDDYDESEPDEGDEVGLYKSNPVDP